MKVTRNLILFTLINLISSIAFFTLLAKGIGITEVENEPNTYVTSTPFIYGLVWLVSGALLGGTDKIRNSRVNLGFAYHAASCLVVLTAMIYAFLTMDVFRNLGFIAWPTAVMAISLVIHWIVMGNQPKGIDKKDAFK